MNRIGYSEIKDIIVNRLGLRDQASYKTYCATFEDKVNPRIPTAEEIALLDPDVIDNRDFWRVAEEIFDTDPVANCQYGTPLSIMSGNRRNLLYAHTSGIIGYLEYLKYLMPRARVLEIGAGYGSLRNWVEVNTQFEYHGVDVYPKLRDIEPTAPSGFMTEATKLRQFDAVVSSNVFQHLSVNQRRTYYRDIHTVLAPDGFFFFNVTTDTYAPDSPFRDGQGRMWMRHYGQFTEIQKAEDIRKDLTPYFYYINENGNYARGFMVRRRELTPKPDPVTIPS